MQNEKDTGAGCQSIQWQSCHGCHGNDKQGMHAYRSYAMLASRLSTVAVVCIVVKCSSSFGKVHVRCGGLKWIKIKEYV